ncbi:MAG: hypothetical protein ACR2QH_05540 [Geminicoccaceae bacterium]
MASKLSKRRRGRPGIFGKPEVFRAYCEAYFEHLQYEDDRKTLRKEPTAPTVARLALFVGFGHVQTFHEQANRGSEFHDVVTWCRSKIRAYHEERVAASLEGSFAWLRRNASDEWGEDKSHTMTVNNALLPTISFVKPKPLREDHQQDGDG